MRLSRLQSVVVTTLSVFGSTACQIPGQTSVLQLKPGSSLNQRGTPSPTPSSTPTSIANPIASPTPSPRVSPSATPTMTPTPAPTSTPVRDASVPAWVPPSGYFADVPMLNNAADVAPSFYSGGDLNTAFSFWGGSAILEDYSPLGAQVYHSAGHEAGAGLPNIQITLISDFSTLKWSAANMPAAPNPNTLFSNVNGLAPDGTPYNPHTYLGLQEMPAAWGGASKGTLVQMLFAGAPFGQKINLMDVSKSTNGYTQMVTNQPQNAMPSEIRFDANGVGGSYPISVIDKKRQGWWLATSGSIDYTLFISKDGTITQYPALGGNMQDGSMVLADSLNLLIAIDGGYESYGAQRKLYIRDLSTGQVTTNTTLGTVPSLSFGYDGSPTPNYHRPNMLGLQWVESLGAIVGLDDTTTPPSIVKLTPPATNPATNPWTWSTIPVQHWNQGDPSGSSVLRASQNGYWSKFRWVDTLHAFVFCTSATTKPQIIKLQ